MGEDAARLASRLVCFGFDGYKPDDHAREMIAKGCGACIIFDRNIRNPEQVATLCADLKRLASPRPLLVMIDQEGGRVRRFRPPHFADIPAAASIGACSNPIKAAGATGQVIARELRACHVDMTLAPVLDVNTNPNNAVIGDRSYGSKFQTAAKCGSSFIENLQANGVAGCAKHWPGHGDTREDSHDALPSLPHHISRLESIEMAPFRAAVSANVASALVAHLLVPAIEPRAHVPASCSERAVTHLRKNLRFGDGVVMTDDMEMGALKHIRWPNDESDVRYDSGAVPRAAAEGLRAGIDLFLACHTRQLQLDIIDALTRAIERDESTKAKATAANRRLDALCDAYVSVAPPGPFGTSGPTTVVDPGWGTTTVARAMGAPRGRL